MNFWVEKQVVNKNNPMCKRVYISDTHMYLERNGRLYCKLWLSLDGEIFEDSCFGFLFVCFFYIFEFFIVHTIKIIKTLDTKELT